MKLRNKKTGEIGNLVLNINPNRESYSVLSTENGDTVCGNLVKADYNSLAELEREWEDVPEEPKEHWTIGHDGAIFKLSEWENRKDHEEIGNYFETEEEAEKAVEKLKAWKRMKDKCNFRFTGIEQDERGMLKGVKVSYDRKNVTFSERERVIKDLMLLFGGEE